jgi:MtN3 and saliva related transmembrane protein
MNMEFIGLAAGILKTVSFGPQLIKTIFTKKAEDVSMFTFILCVLSAILWIWYALVTGRWSILLANSGVLLICGSQIIFKRYYDKKNLNNYINNFEKNDKFDNC